MDPVSRRSRSWSKSGIGKQQSDFKTLALGIARTIWTERNDVNAVCLTFSAFTIAPNYQYASQSVYHSCIP